MCYDKERIGTPLDAQRTNPKLHALEPSSTVYMGVDPLLIGNSGNHTHC